MSEFTKNKIAFAIALLAALFTISPITLNIGFLGFSLFGINIALRHLYYFISISLTVAVYFYGIQFLTERPILGTQRLGDIFYSIAIVAPVLYVMLYIVVILSSVILKLFNSQSVSHVFSIGLSALSGIIVTLVTERLRKIFNRKEKKSTVESYEKEEISYLDRAKKLVESGYYDLSVVECFKAIELSIKKTLYEKGYPYSISSPREMIEIAVKNEIINQNEYNVINNMRVLRNNAAHNKEPIKESQAKEMLIQANLILASLSSN